MTTPTLPPDVAALTRPAPAKKWAAWSDNAIKFVPYVPSPEEDLALTKIAIEKAPVASTLSLAISLLNRAETEPDTLFLPVLWVNPPTTPTV